VCQAGPECLESHLIPLTSTSVPVSPQAFDPSPQAFALSPQPVALGRRRAVTQQLRIARSEGQDLVVRVRSALRSHLGHRNEGLVRYRIRPIRRRSRALREEVGIAALPDKTSPEES